ncbi:TBC-domain-containing protein [Lichtheimia hyalospora FSU 10163]|nr:TBC-domain-containing protein [Lichtheimia hyalospora FSU 10163]
MNPLTRSSTTIRSPSSTQSDRRGDKPSRLRIRSSSFSIRRQRSDSHFNKPVGHHLSTSNQRRPSFESRTLVKKEHEPVQLSEEANSSLLTVSDGHNGGAASSIDSTGSDDEEEDDYRFNKELPQLVQSPSELDNSKPLERQKSLTSSFKGKLHLSSPIRAKSMFDGLRGFHHHQQQHRNVSSPIVHYDEMSSPQPYDADRDPYGFIKGTQWVSLEEYDAFQQSYQPIAARRLQKWRQLLAEHNNHWPSPSSKFKRYIRKGIPSELRGQAWFYYSGGESKQQAHPNVYQQLVAKAENMGENNESLDVIERDLHRTFPDNIRFKSKGNGSPDGSHDDDVPAIQSLRRVLLAFSVYSPTIGYCQSLNYIAGMLLLFMDEENAFWTFVALIEDILPPNIYDVTMEGANIDQTILMMLISERCPQIWNRISGNKSFWECEQGEANGMPTTSLVTSHWFLTLFINILPTESVLRVWDCLFYEGQRALFRVALAIFKMNEQAILAVDDSLEVFQVIQVS